MATIGSVFLGDVQQRLRLLSSTSPPASPSPTQSPSAMRNLAHDAVTISSTGMPPPPPAKTKPDQNSSPSHISPELSLELRLRWLEAILLGVRQHDKDRKGKDKAHALKHGESLLRVAEDVQRRLDNVIQSNDGLRRFMDHYDQHAHLLTPTFALSGTLPPVAPSYESMSPSELEAFLVEMEPDIRAAERDMREIEALEKKGVTSAGKLPDYDTLRPRLKALLRAHEEDLELAGSLERRIAVLMERHATQVDALSELFVAWDDTISGAEAKVLKLEREREGRRRLGLE